MVISGMLSRGFFFGFPNGKSTIWGIWMFFFVCLEPLKQIQEPPKGPEWGSKMKSRELWVDDNFVWSISSGEISPFPSLIPTHQSR
jgi:hypothetical protein